MQGFPKGLNRGGVWPTEVEIATDMDKLPKQNSHILTR